MTEYEWRSYDCNEDSWDTLENMEELTQALGTEGLEVWLYRWTESHGLTDTAQVVEYKLPEHMPEEGYKVPKRYHKMLERLAT